MLTSPITNQNYLSRVIKQISPHTAAPSSLNLDSRVPLPVLAPLSASETLIAPGGTVSRLILTVNESIDLCSDDPIISDVSLQVLRQEIAYAAFCGANNVMVQGPKPEASDAGLKRYANAIKEALSIGIYVSIIIMLPMGESPARSGDIGAMADFERPEFYMGQSPKGLERQGALESWDAWHAVRSMCNYSSKLFVGKPSSVFHRSHPC